MVSLVSLIALPTLMLSLVLGALAAPMPLDTSRQPSTLSPRIEHEGQGTYFYPGEGNCGGWNTSNDPIVAISTQIYDDGSNCGQWVYITNTANGQTTYGQVQDSCPSCGAGSLDMSPAVFQNLADLSEGDIPIEWHYMNRAWSP
ncbi:RlpA-like double-psi beta-barrel-protein domain-containing protein-containing protein [Gautieria morchelliformis]|nr:RlpA-like double-psi beta-barrel-protein domain-containing protein-containing protein [Gautieria morchelliformis]